MYSHTHEVRDTERSRSDVQTSVHSVHDHHAIVAVSQSAGTERNSRDGGHGGFDFAATRLIYWTTRTLGAEHND
jgi:hypothetical protein